MIAWHNASLSVQNTALFPAGVPPNPPPDRVSTVYTSYGHIVLVPGLETISVVPGREQVAKAGIESSGD